MSFIPDKIILINLMHFNSNIKILHNSLRKQVEITSINPKRLPIFDVGLFVNIKNGEIVSINTFASGKVIKLPNAFELAVKKL